MDIFSYIYIKREGMTTSEDIINKRAYEKYKLFALPTVVEKNPYLLKKGWLVRIQKSKTPPDKYRYYSFDEFLKTSKEDFEFGDFYKLLFEKSKSEYYQEIVERLPKEL